MQLLRGRPNVQITGTTLEPNVPSISYAGVDYVVLCIL